MKEENGKSKKQAAETLKKSSGPDNSVSTKKLSKWTKVLLTATWIGLLMTLLKGPLTGRPASWPIWENKRWINIWKATKGGSITTKPWLGIWCSLSYYPTCKEADCRRKCNCNKGVSKKLQRSRYTLPSQRLQQNSWKKRRNDLSINFIN